VGERLKREEALREAGAAGRWDIIVVGGGATGLGAAVEAASRGYRTLLVEAQDFAKATSSRSTKLVHGGVRYLQQGNVKLVLEALRERGRMLRNAPHLAHKASFIVPAYALWEFPFYGTGLTLYDLLAGKEGLGRSRLLSKSGVQDALPTLRRKALKGGILYYDGQFDDARFAIALLRTLWDLGGVAINYTRAIGLLKQAGRVSGVQVIDEETGAEFDCTAKVVINATGIFCDEMRRMDEPQAQKILAVSQGSHIVLPREFLPGKAALMIPRTADGRVLFAIPWHEHVVVGTTDDPVPTPEYEPRAMDDERNFLLEHSERFLGRRPAAGEVLSVWSGQRPLVRKPDAASTAALSRDHTILISGSGLITITGGKWTTYRRMGEDVIDRAAPQGGLAAAPSRTASLRLHGSIEQGQIEHGQIAGSEWERVYGADLPLLKELEQSSAELAQGLDDRLPFRRSEVVWAARYEMARSVEDVLARRTRALFLNAQASLDAAPATAHLLAVELGRDTRWEQNQVAAYRKTAAAYVWRD
jgi:glycerol-3-phosphate dehydrogenase